MSKKVEKKVERENKPRSYECLLIIENTQKEEQRAKLVEKFSKMTGDEACKVDKWGLKKFATEINHKKDGFYYLMNFKSTPDVPRKMGMLMNITDGIVRYMFVVKDEVKKKKPVKKKEIKETKE